MPEAGCDGSEIAPEQTFCSVVIPVYNSEAVLPELYSRLIAVMEALGKRFELVFVDDDSIDGSWAVLEAIARCDSRIAAIQLAQNVGQGEATLVGLRYTRGETLVTLDDDLQHDPEDIPRMLARLDGPEGYTVVFGIPEAFRRSTWRRIASWLMNIVFSRILRKPVALRFSGFRAMRRSVAGQLCALRSPDSFVSALLFRITPHIGIVRVAHSNSALGSSRYTLVKLAKSALGYFGALSDKDRRHFIVGSAVAAAVFLTLALAGLYHEPSGLLAGTAIGGTMALAIVAVGLGSAGAVAEFRIRAFRRKPVSEIAIRRMIAREPGKDLLKPDALAAS